MIQRAKNAFMLLLLFLAAATTTQSAVCETTCALNAGSHLCSTARTMEMASMGSGSKVDSQGAAAVRLSGTCHGDCFHLIGSTAASSVVPMDANLGRTVLPVVAILSFEAELVASARADASAIASSSPPNPLILSLRV